MYLNPISYFNFSFSFSSFSNNSSPFPFELTCPNILYHSIAASTIVKYIIRFPLCYQMNAHYNPFYLLLLDIFNICNRLILFLIKQLRLNKINLSKRTVK